MPVSKESWLGQSLERFEDAALLSGQGRYLDDLPTAANTKQAAILRSPIAHGEILSIDLVKAAKAPGVVAILTGKDVVAMGAPLVVGVKAPIECWPIAIERVRYVGEPVAVVIAEDRYLAEDALDLIDVSYRKLAAVVDPEEAITKAAPILHPKLDSNVGSDRSFCYGDPEEAFATAAREVSIKVRYPRNAVTPIETYGVLANYDPHESRYDIVANFQGPFSIHAVIARALKVPGNHLRLRTPPDSGGSFGVKQGVFPYVVLIGFAARVAGCPVKWIEDRLEHLTASTSATNRVVQISAALSDEGKILALDWDQIEDVGAYLRAPEPATLYRMHGNITGAYDIRHVRIRNRVVMSNKTPTGLNRGFGGPQVYFALERLMQRIAVELDQEPLDIIRRNLIPAGVFPHRTAAGALYDSGNYPEAVARALREGGYEALCRRRDDARKAGRIYGIGLCAVVEPSVSNMGYITTVLTAEERHKAGPKNGAQAIATITIDPLGSVSVKTASVPQGQGHRTVAAQVVADVLGLEPSSVQVLTDVDTAKDSWSIASGNYASRFAPAVAGTVQLAALGLRQKLSRLAAINLNVRPEDITFADGFAFATDNSENRIAFNRLGATEHWAPETLPDDVDHTLQETAFWNPPELQAPNDKDEINSSLCHGFIFDFCGVEIDKDDGKIQIDKYVTMHDCGRVLHPGMVRGQILGGFANAIGAALYEEYSYSPEGDFLTGTFADYLVPTVHEVPEPLILHMETPSPFTPLGAKGVGEGNCMSTPVCLANAVADALGESDIELPIKPAKLIDFIADEEPAAARENSPRETVVGGRNLQGSGRAEVAAPPEKLWRTLLDPQTLIEIIPGCHTVTQPTETTYLATVDFRVGPVRGRYQVNIELSDLEPPCRVTLSGSARGPLGDANGRGNVELRPTVAGTELIYRYDAAIGGKVAAVGGRLLDGAAKVVIGQFFQAMARHVEGGGGPSQQTFWRRLRVWLGSWR